MKTDRLMGFATAQFRSVGIAVVTAVMVLVIGSGMATAGMAMQQQEASLPNLSSNELLIQNHKVVTLSFNDISLLSALKQLARRARVGISFNPEIIPDKKVNSNFNDVPVHQALYSLLEGTDLEVILPPTRDVIVIKRKEFPIAANLQQTVRGRITDRETGDVLPGVNIIVRNTNIGTSSDADGEFSLNVPSLNDTLVFTFIGYRRQEVPIDGRTQVNISMQPELLRGAGVVVTAFGYRTEREATSYSTSEVPSSDINKAVEPNLVNSLSGRVAGVNVQQNTTGPGGSSRMIIRGNTSLAGDNQPLYVVDGMPINNTRQGDQGPQGRTVHGDRGDGISHINPNDIESMTVLKGGQATALYGSRASNGVVLITTKEGSARDGIGIEFHSNTTFRTINKYPDWQYQYGHGDRRQRPQTQAEAASVGRLSFGEPMDGAMYTGINGQRPYSPVPIKDNYNNFYRVGKEFTNTLAFSGGSESYNYRVSLSNLDAQSLMPNSSYNRKTVRVNLNTDVNDRLTIGTDVQYNIVEGTNRPQGGYATYNANWNVALLANTMDIRDLSPGYRLNPDPVEMLWNASSAATNAYWLVNMYQNGDDENRLVGNVELNFDLTDDILIRGYVGQDIRNFEGYWVIPTGTAYRPRGEYNSTERDITETNGQLTVNYQNTFLEDFNVNAMVGGKMEKQVFDENGLSGEEFIVPYFYSYSNLATTSNSRDYREQATNSVFGSAEFNYRQIFYLTLTGRQDWFSTLNPENNSIFYPSVGGSVILNQAMDLPESIDFFKLRGSWAQIGSAIVPPYATNRSYTFEEGGFAGQSVQNLSGIPTPNLKPLEKTTYEIGFDLELFDRRLAFDLSLYDETTREDIVNTEIARSSGYSTTRVNVGELNNKGIEFMVRGYPVQDNTGLNWSTSFNIAYNKSEVRQLAEGLDQITLGSMIGGGLIKHTVGQPYGMIYGEVYKRNENGQIVFNRTSGLPVPEEQMRGKGVAPLTMGFSNRFDYKNFSLDVLVDAKFGSVLYSNTHWYAYRMGLPKETLAGRENGLTLSGVDQDGQPFELTVPRNDLRSAFYNNNDYPGRFVHDNSFIKLREVVFTYTLPDSFIDFAYLQSATISVVGRNLWNIYDPMPHVDPEAGNSSSNLQGVEGFGLPSTRNIGINVSLDF